MRALKGERLLEAWGRGAPQSDLDRAVTLLAAASPDQSEADLAAVSIPERNLALLRLHQFSFGDSLRGYVPCSSCGARLEFEASASAMADRLEAVKPRVAATWEAEGAQFSMRPADSRDLAAVACQNDSQRARRLLLERCTTPPRVEGCEEMAARTFNELHEGAEILLSLFCPACAQIDRVDLDIARFLWSEVRHAALGLLREVHELASAYGWSESAILTMDGARRRVYLEMARS
jgi:hypothetical protein